MRDLNLRKRAFGHMNLEKDDLNNSTNFQLKFNTFLSYVYTIS